MDTIVIQLTSKCTFYDYSYRKLYEFVFYYHFVCNRYMFRILIRLVIYVVGITIYLHADIFISSPSYNLSGSVDNSGIILKEGSKGTTFP